jgi:hypothetical protein
LLPAPMLRASHFCRVSLSRYGISSSTRPHLASFSRIRHPGRLPLRGFAVQQSQRRPPNSSSPHKDPSSTSQSLSSEIESPSSASHSPSSLPNQETSSEDSPTTKSIHENIYTLPNLLTVSRILACPVLGWSIVEGNIELATGLLAYAGATDLVSCV